jgi:hypothetical protein
MSRISIESLWKMILCIAERLSVRYISILISIFRAPDVRGRTQPPQGREPGPADCGETYENFNYNGLVEAQGLSPKEI